MRQRTYNPTRRKPARRTQSRRGLLPTAQIGRMGNFALVWLKSYAGAFSIAIGWIFAFVMIAIPKTHENAFSIIEIACFGSAFFGFGLGWIFKSEADHPLPMWEDGGGDDADK